ncbi:hypothetical protein C8F01DRAFT_1013173 [Mycena amicta]|nr:hypothetical protein C8F01DRAFT_145879 [Mycena amicta]KAJ7073207.1 hypothetical protein C8F01DRAFT_1013173 [Mycena amicta]
MPYCTGCKKNFPTNGGYRIHFWTTTKAACQEIHAQSRAKRPLASDDDSSPDSESPSESEEELGNTPTDGLPLGSTHFTGDFFGTDYSPDDFGYISDDDAQSDLDDLNDNTGDPLGAANSAWEEDSWEPERLVGIPSAMDVDNLNPQSEPEKNPPPPPKTRVVAEDRFHQPPVIEHYPGDRAGEAIYSAGSADELYRAQLGNPSEFFRPFGTKMDWEVGHWAKTRGPGSTAFTDLLKIEGVRQALGLSYSTMGELDKIIDEKLPGRPKFTRSEIVVQGESFDLYSRNIIECVRALFADTNFSPYLVFRPERHYTDTDKTIRLFHEMHTGRWWWSTQKEVEAHKPGATIIPIILSSDKTQLTMFGTRSAYPVYMTIGNIPKAIRRKPSYRAYVLLAYLPTANLSHITNLASRRRTLGNLFHVCLSHITAPLRTAGVDGIDMVTGGGDTHRGHPICACYAGDYPEQILTTCAITGECPSCECEHGHLGDANCTCPRRNLENILRALDTLDQGGTIYAKSCAAVRIKPIVHPFWEDLPYTNIFACISPDILHQCYQGIIKHLIAWIKEAYGEAEIDARCRRLPPNHNIRVFLKGISKLNRVSGREHDQISRFILGILIDLPLPDGSSSVRLVRAVRAILDFVYLAQYPLHSDETLVHMENARQRFHDNKEIFVELGIRPDGFNLPKLHSWKHYEFAIRWLGTTDNCNTEYTERLHIDLAKEAFRSTNFKDEFPQMVLWLERREKMARHAQYIQWRLDGCPPPPIIENLHPGVVYERELVMAKHPTKKSVPFTTLQREYGAKNFVQALSRYIAYVNEPTLSRAQLEHAANDVRLMFNSVPVFHRIKFSSRDPYVLKGPEDLIVDSIHVQPRRTLPNGDDVPARFDTAVINIGDGGATGATGYQIGQVRVIFTLPPRVRASLFPDARPAEYLAYVEWFSAFSKTPEPDHLLYKIKRAEKDGQRLASVIPVQNIRRSIHLLPKFGPVAPPEWKSSNVLEMCKTFFANSLSDRHIYMTLY